MKDLVRMIGRKEKALYLLASALFLGLCAYLLWRDSPASATVSGALALALLLFRILPVVESFEIFGLKAKLKQQIGEAEELLNQIRMSALVSSRLSYTELAWMNRMGSIPWSKKRELQLEIDALLKGLGVSGGDVSDMKAEFMEMISLDLYRTFKHCVRFKSYELLRRIDQEQKELFGNAAVDQSDPRWIDLQERRRQLDIEQAYLDDELESVRKQRVGDMTKVLLDSIALPADDYRTLEILSRRVEDLSDACWREGTITPDAEAFLDEYGSPQDKLYKELFTEK